MAIIFVVSLLGVITMHLMATRFIWRSLTPGEIRSQLMKLSLLSTVVWIGVPVLLAIIGALSDPAGLALAPLSSGHVPAIDERVFALTFGLPSIFSEDISCLSFLVLPPGLFALSHLTVLTRRGYGTYGFWITLISVGYAAFLFGGADVADISGKDNVWIAIWFVAGAIIGFIVKLSQTVIRYRPSVHADWPTIGITLGWVGAGGASALAGLLLGMIPAGDWLATHQPTFKDPLPIIAAISSGLVLTAIIGLIVALMLEPTPGYTPSSIMAQNEPTQAQQS